MPWQDNLPYLMNQPVGVSLRNGQGVSGVLCDVSHNTVYLMEYMYQTQYATKHYPFNQIQNITPYPSCSSKGPLY